MLFDDSILLNSNDRINTKWYCGVYFLVIIFAKLDLCQFSEGIESGHEYKKPPSGGLMGMLLIVGGMVGVGIYIGLSVRQIRSLCLYTTFPIISQISSRHSLRGNLR